MLTLGNPRYAVGNSAAWGALLGAVFFLFVFGVRILKPTYIEWQLSDDPAHLYLGWEYFRHESWQFPFGKVLGYGTPEGSSIFYTDSIPLCALFFKCVRWALPEPFQYTGLWILICYVLQGAFGWCLSALTTESARSRLLMTGFFVLSPSLLERSNRHISLMSHWLILAALYLALEGREAFQQRHPKLNWAWAWGAVVVVSGLVHLYICLMVVVIYASAVVVFLGRHRWRSVRAYGSAALPMLALGLALYLEGGFVVGAGGWVTSDYLFSLFSMNLLSPLAPVYFDRPESVAHVSYFLSSHRTPNAGYHEGFNYLGLGTLALLLIALVTTVITTIDAHSNEPAVTTRHDDVRAPVIATGVACLVLAFLSLSNEVKLGPEVIFRYHYGRTLQHYADIFRSSGRFFWPMGYLLLWLALSSLGRIAKHRHRWSMMILNWTFVLQVLDLSQFVKHFAWSERPAVHFDTPFRSDFWRQTVPHYRSVFYAPAGDETYYIPLGVMTAPKAIGINVVFKPRSDPDGDHGENERIEQDLRAGQLRARTLYVFKDRALLRRLENKLPKEKYIVREVDGFGVAASYPKSDSLEFSATSPMVAKNPIR